MIVFASRTGNIRYIVSRMPLIPSTELEEDLLIQEPYFLFTYTDGLGDIPLKVAKFLEANHLYLRGVIASGNTNFGKNFCESANKVSILYDVPIIRKLDLRGTRKDIEEIENQYKIIIEGES